MALSPGTRLGPYEVSAQIGMGGMGEVYRATDTTLKRQVAIKVLPEAVATDPERLARFQREAEVLAALNHPNIAGIYGLERSNQQTALVMEFVDGPTLADRIAHGAVPVDEALTIARQIGDALEVAHGQGIVHRDLKPANIKVRPDGTVKVLDFGLAKALGGPGSGARDSGSGGATAGALSMSPTITTPAMTQAGLILGTAAYMSPEQARGRLVDKRADIWGFGVVLFEMVTGKRLFEGEDLTDTLASVVKVDPDLSAAPPELRRLLTKCLQKDPKNRLRDIGDVWELLDSPASSAAVAGTPAPARAGWIAAGIALLAALALAFGWWRASSPEDRPLLRANLDLAGFVGPEQLAISQDGTRIAYVTRSEDGVSRLATRLLANPEPRILGGTEGASLPFFSPDGQWIGFGTPGELKKVSVLGGTPQKVADAPAFQGASWTEGFIVAGLNIGSGGFARISESGGQAEPMIATAGPTTYALPQFLPGGRDVLVTAQIGSLAPSASLISMDTRQASVLIPNAAGSLYIPVPGNRRGYIVYGNGNTLMAVGFDPATKAVMGQGVPVLEDWAGGSRATTAGTFAYSIGAVAQNQWPLGWLRRNGTAVEPLLETRGIYTGMRVSPDGRRLAAMSADGDQGAIVVYDLENHIQSQLTERGEARFQVAWTNDSQKLIWSRVSADGTWRLVWKRADGSGEIQTLLDVPDGAQPNFIRVDDVAPDGRWLTFGVASDSTGLDEWVVDLDPVTMTVGTPRPLIVSPRIDAVAQFSSDGKWISYVSDESGSFGGYVQPFPGPGGRRKISDDGAFSEWSNNGHELLYQRGATIAVVDYKVQGDEFIAGPPREWSKLPNRLILASRSWTPHPDGERLVIIPVEASDQQTGQQRVGLLLNFVGELQRRVPLQ